MPFIKFEEPPKVCKSPEHYPPTMIVLTPGKHYYQCPACGEITLLDVAQVD